MYAISWLPSFPINLARSRSRKLNKTQLHNRKRQINAMRAVVQRVASASVEVEGRLVSEIGPGLLVLVGLHEFDTDADADYVMQKKYGVLLVSQFTLYGILKGNKPDFHVAMPPQKAKPFYDSLVDKFRKSYNPDAIKGKCAFQLHLVLRSFSFLYKSRLFILSRLFSMYKPWLGRSLYVLLSG
ncbi:hypothetical protein CISIN_1g028617mg [Citrus sinensis]|uniref:D-aminoacyl-tRNA deacylase n=1 Tax=Citrus sinensis TaxID=2711 RepID=A0A067GDV9_CITSI|nr:hypothetical protein CISIN_1g028617mg [Citrus sinensis]